MPGAIKKDRKALHLKKHVMARYILFLLAAALLFLPFLPLAGHTPAAYAASCPAQISDGSSSQFVKALQGILNQMYGTAPFASDTPYAFTYPLSVDGNFGGQTLAAVEDYQHAFGLSVDGNVGPQTWGSLGFCTGNGTVGSTSGGGCIGSNEATTCLNFNSSADLVAGATLKNSDTVAAFMIVIEDGVQISKSTWFNGSTPWPAGTGLGGPTGIQASRGHIYQAILNGRWTSGNWWVKLSPAQFT